MADRARELVAQALAVVEKACGDACAEVRDMAKWVREKLLEANGHGAAVRQKADVAKRLK